MWPLWAFFAIMAVWATTPWWPEHWFRLPLMYKSKQDLEEPILPSELDDWDAEFTRLTGKTIWQARCEADPNLLKSAMMPGTAQNNINPYYGLQNQAQIDAVARQLHLQQQMGPPRDQSQLSGLLGGLGNSLGGLFH
jgi:hypothetical protein